MALKHVKPNEIVNLASGMEGSEEVSRVALVKTSQFTALRVSLKSGDNIPAHQVPGCATVLCLRGSVEISLDDRKETMSEGDWLYLNQGQQHAGDCQEFRVR